MKRPDFATFILASPNVGKGIFANRIRTHLNHQTREVWYLLKAVREISEF
jgi:hypothetical protein